MKDMKTGNCLSIVLLKNLIDFPLIYISTKTRFSKRDFQRGAIKLTKRLIATYLIGFFAFSSIAGLFLFNPWNRTSEAAWFNDGWGYRKRIDVTVTSDSSDRSNKDLYLTVDTTGITNSVQTNCEDLRFTNINGTVLPYYIQSCNDNSASNTIWVKADLIPKDTTTFTLYMYYGNPSVISGSNITDFPFLQDLAAYWNFDEATSWATNCTTESVLDLSGNTNHGKPCPNGSAVTQTGSGKFGSAANFDGTNDRIAVDNSSTVNVIDWTLSGWFYDTHSDFNHDDGMIIGKQTSDGEEASPFRVQIAWNHINVFGEAGYVESGIDYDLASNGYSTNTWIHYAATYDSVTSTMSLYLNGTLVAGPTVVDAPGVNDDDIEIGGNSFQGRHWTGRIDDQRIYNRALSAAEITLLYSSIVGVTTSFGSEEKGPSPAAYWKFNEGYGTTVNDSTGNNNSGTFTEGFVNWKENIECISEKCLYFSGDTSGAGSGSETTIDNNVKTAAYQDIKQNIVWKNSQVGYVFYSDPTLTDFYYKKTIDGGITWGSDVMIDDVDAASKFNIWYDRWTPNNSDTKIHIVWHQGTNDLLRYASLDTSSDTLSSTVNVASPLVGCGIWDNCELEITKAEGGNLYLYALTGGGDTFYRSTDNGANWTTRTNWPDNGTVRNDDLQLLVPAATGDVQDIALFSWGSSNDTIKVAVYDDSANSWGSYVDVASSMIDPPAWNYQPWSVSIRHSDKHAILAAWSQMDNAAADLKVFDITLGATPSVSALTDVITNSSESAQTSVFIDNNTNDIYVAYIKGGTWTATTQVYYKVSTDDGSSWGSQTQISTTLDDHRVVSAGFGVKSGDSGRFEPAWINDDLNDLLVNPGSSIAIGSSGSLTVANTVSGVQSVSMWVKPDSFTSTTPLIDLNGTAKITANSSGVISASGFTSPTIYVNGVVGTTLVEDVWQFVTVTTGTGISASSIKIGTDGTNYFKGYIDEVKLYGFALSSSQVLANNNGAGNPDGLASVLGTSTKNNSALTENLVGYWKFDESAWSPTNCTGTTVLDSSGNGLHGSACGGTNGGDLGKYGRANDFDGTDDYVNLPDNAVFDLSPTGKYTWSLWINPDDFEEWNAVWWQGQDTSNQLAIVAHTSTTGDWGPVTAGIAVGYYTDGGSNKVMMRTVDNALTTAVWQHVVVTYDGTQPVAANRISIYVNGIDRTERSDTDAIAGTVSSVASDSAYIGYEDVAGENFDGDIDEVRYYNRALSPADAAALYNWAPGPVGQWDFEEGAGSTTYDSSGNHNNGTLVNSPTYTNGKVGKALAFSRASTQHVNAGSSASLDNIGSGTGMTLEAWVYNNALGASATWYQIMTKNSDGAPSQGWYWEIASSGSDLDFCVDYTTTDLCVTDQGLLSGTAGTWQHLALTWNGTTTATGVRIFKNGVESIPEIRTNGSGTRVSDASHNLLIGAGASGSPTDGIDGKIDQVRIYNYERTRAQIIEGLNSGHPAPGSPVGTPYAHWKFEEGVLNSCIGGTNDICNSGNGGSSLDGVFGGTQTWVNDGKVGRALSFDGSTKSGSLSALDGTEAANQISWSMWVKPTTLTTSDCLFCKVQAPSGTPSGSNWAIITDSSDATAVRIVIPTATNSVAAYGLTPTGTLSNGTWTHLAAVYDGTKTGNANRLTVYVNGKKQALTFAGTLPATTTSSVSTHGRIGSDSAGTANFYNGYLDEVKLYLSALTDSQISLDMNQASSQVLGSLSSTQTAPNSAGAEYCVPGDTTSCNGPVGRWTFEPTATTNANNPFSDRSGNGLGGVASGDGNVRVGVGKIGKGLNLVDGVNEYVAVSDNSLLRPGSGSFTIMAWAKPSDTNQLKDIIFKQNGGTGAGYMLRISSESGGGNGQRLFAAFLQSGASYRGAYSGTSTPGTGDVADGSWHHYAAVYDTSAGTVYLYVDGIRVEQTAFSLGSAPNITDTTEFRISNATTSTFSGPIDEVRVYNYARTPAQIAWDVNQGEPVAHWKMDECQGTTINDASGNGLTGTWNGASSGTNTAVGTCATSGTAWGDGVSGKRNYSLDFDGTNDYVNIADNDKLRPKNGNWSVSIWANPANSNQTSPLITKRQNGSPFEMWAIYICGAVECTSSGQNMTFLFQDHSTGNLRRYVTTTDVADGNWHMYTAVADASANTITLYVDGIPQPTSGSTNGSMPTIDNTDPVRLGNDNGSTYYTGKLDDARVYNYPLTATQVKALFNDGIVRFGPAAGAP